MTREATSKTVGSRTDERWWALAVLSSSTTYGAIDDARAVTLDRAWQQHPERFATRPQPPQIRNEVWINQPAKEPELATAKTT